jgi:P27 family predicted phage terminase small subunit
MKSKSKPKLCKAAPFASEWSAPAHLSKLAAAEFLRTVDMLRARGTLEFTDSKLVARRAELVELGQLAYESLKRDGLLIKTPRGGVAHNPASKVLQDTSSLLRLIDTTLGLVAPRDRRKPDLKADPLAIWREKVRTGEL